MAQPGMAGLNGSYELDQADLSTNRNGVITPGQRTRIRSEIGAINNFKDRWVGATNQVLSMEWVGE